MADLPLSDDAVPVLAGVVDPGPRDPEARLRAALQKVADETGGKVTARWYRKPEDEVPVGSVTVYPTGTRPEDFPDDDGEDEGCGT